MDIPKRVKEKLRELPDRPGIYLMRDRRGRVIYVGKAVSLRKRVQSYFRRGTLVRADPKLRGLVRSTADLDFLELRSEAEATLTESRFIKDYRPRYNIMLKDDKRFLLLKTRLDQPYPVFKTARIRKDDHAEYFGPYTNSAAARASLEFIEKRFGLRRCSPQVPGPDDYRHCIDDVVRFCSAPCMGRIDQQAYSERVAEACAFLRGERPVYLGEVRSAMLEAAGRRDFEQAAALRDTLRNLHDTIKQRTRIGKTPALQADEARKGLDELRELLLLNKTPHVIEAFDISNISGTLAVGGMVCAVEGVPRPQRYRQFRIRTRQQPDDPGMMAEVILRRYRRLLNEKAPLPDLVLVDGGITQVRAAMRSLRELGLSKLDVVGLAKRLEEMIRDRDGGPRAFVLPRDSQALQIFTRLRDEAHRFALTYHRKLRMRRIRESQLDDIPGIGNKRKQQLLAHFGSVARLRKATEEEITAVPGFGVKTARLIMRHIAE